MQCPTLNELPPPPSGMTGWPWTEESRRLPGQTLAGHPWPCVSIITPSFNQGEFIEQTIRSVLLQGHCNLEYLVFDGGSSDNSVEIIKKYSRWLTYWSSESDSGQTDAINRGLKMASGDFATWINSDDLLCKNALTEHATLVGFDSNVVYIGFCIYIDEHGKRLSTHRGRVFSLEDLVRIETVWRSPGNQGHIDQPAVLFPRALAISVGGMDPHNHRTMDYELWGKFLIAGVKFEYTHIPFGMFRQHSKQKTKDGLQQTRSLLQTAANLVRIAEELTEVEKNEILAELRTYGQTYEKNYWRGTGRLAKMGLPPAVVIPLRRLRAALQKKLVSEAKSAVI